MVSERDNSRITRIEKKLDKLHENVNNDQVKVADDVKNI